ncbi:low affinity potassium transporter, partial [Rhizopus stolonifer]
MATSAVTNTGLNTIPVSSLSVTQLLVIYLSSFLSSHIMISVLVVTVRKHYFSKRFEDILLFNKERQLREANQRQFERNLQELARSKLPRNRLSFLSLNSQRDRLKSTISLSTSLPIPKKRFSCSDDTINTYHGKHSLEQDRKSCSESDISTKGHSRHSVSQETMTESQSTRTSLDRLEKAHLPQQTNIMFACDIEQQRERARKKFEKERQFDDLLHKVEESGCSSKEVAVMMNMDQECTDKKEPTHKSELTRQQRYRLGGAEYRALDLLSRLVPTYYFFFIFGFGFILRSYVFVSPYVQSVLTVNPWSFSFFTSLSAFNNLGLSQVDESMEPFQREPLMLTIIMVLVLAGNTAFAILLRLIIWIMYQLTPESFAMRKETLRYVLDHPRRCYTTLFPSYQTKWLLVVLIAITLAQFLCFVGLNYWLPVLEQLDTATRILSGLFQSVSTRSAGYTVIDVMNLNPATLLAYIFAMYISVYPVTILMRHSNVYQERALGIYKGNNEGQGCDLECNSSQSFHHLKRTNTLTSVVNASRNALRGPDFFVRTQIQQQLTSEIFWLIASIFTVCVIETQSIMSPSPITMFSIIYECVSAFGNIGASIGYPGTFTSQSTQYHNLSKLVLIVLMYRGRHRGLPAAIDRAVLLPSEQLQEKEEDFLKRKTLGEEMPREVRETFGFLDHFKFRFGFKDDEGTFVILNSEQQMKDVLPRGYANYSTSKENYLMCLTVVAAQRQETSQQPSELVSNLSQIYANAERTIERNTELMKQMGEMQSWMMDMRNWMSDTKAYEKNRHQAFIDLFGKFTRYMDYSCEKIKKTEETERMERNSLKKELEHINSSLNGKINCLYSILEENVQDIVSAVEERALDIKEHTTKVTDQHLDMIVKSAAELYQSTTATAITERPSDVLCNACSSFIIGLQTDHHPTHNLKCIKDLPKESGSECQNCHSSTQGQRYTCSTCSSFGICSICFQILKTKHNPSHVFVLENVSSTNIPKRTTSDDVPHPNALCNNCNTPIKGVRYK